MPLLSDSVDFSADGASPSPYGIPPGLNSEGRRETPDHARRIWKAYHERQALAAAQRQYSRPVNIDPMLWGDLLSGKLVELIEGERNHPRTIVSGGAADRDGGRCLLPELDDARFHTGHDRAVAAAVGKPKVLRFSDEGSEYTADDFGAEGDFNEMYQRRYTGFDGRFKEARGKAAERAWSRAGHPGDDAVGESYRERRSRERRDCEAQSIPWDLGTNQSASTPPPGTPSGHSRSREGGVGGSGLTGSFGDDLFASDAASALAAGREEGGQQLDSDLQAHPSPHIGPDTHCLIPDEVEQVHRLRDEERADGSNASLATQMEHRLVGGGTGAARKLRGTAARERQEQARIIVKDRYVEEAVRRNRAPFTGDNDGGGDGDDDSDDEDSDNNANSTTCSVTTFETYYIQATQAADALPTVERRFNEDEPGAKHPATIPKESQALPAVTHVVVVPPTPAELEKEKMRAERRAERAAKLEAKRERAKRSAATLDSNGREAPRDALSLQRLEGGGGGSGGSGVVDATDEISLAPSVSSLGSFDEQSGSAPPLVFQQAQEADAAERSLPAVLHLPPALDHTAGENRQAHRRRSRRSIPALPSATTTSARIEEGSACSFPSTDNGSAATVEGVARAERERSSSRLGIAFGVAGRRRRSRRPSNSSNSAAGVRLADPPLAAAMDRDGEEESAPSAASMTWTGAVGAASAPASRTTTAVATAALLKRKINWWRSRPKPPPKVPHRSPLLTTFTRGAGLSPGTTSSSAPSYSGGNSDYGDGRPARNRSAVSMTPSVSSAISRESQHQLPAASVGGTDDDQTMAGSVTSSLTSLEGSFRGLVSVGPLAETDSSVASLPSTSQDSGELVGGLSAAGSAATTSLAPTTGSTAGLAGAGADAGGSSGGTRGRVALGGDKKSRKKRRGRGGTGTVPPVHKIHLGSKKHQKAMQPAERTALLIGACEWGDLAALERLLELGASPLDPYSPSDDESRCVFCQFFLFVLQVGAGLRSRLAPDDSLHTRGLATLIEARLADNPRFLSIPKLRDQDDRGFCLLHHAAAFGNASKVDFLLKRGVDPDVRAGGGGETALLIAARRGQRLHLRVAAALIRAGADMFARDRKGMTALHRAAEVGRKHMCHYLLLVGADKSAQDNEGRTPLGLCHGKHPRVSALLRSFVGCKPPPATILSYMEKVEVQGLDDSTAQELMLQEQAKREAEASEAAAAAASAADATGAADAVCGDDDENSMASWDAASLGGMSGEGGSVLSLGTLATAGRRER